MKKILIFLNTVVWVYLIYLQFFNKLGPYTWQQNMGMGAEPHIVFSLSYLFCVLLLLLIPAFIFWRKLWLSRNSYLIWALQFFVILACTFFWKTDLMQKTLFYNSPTSTYKSIQKHVDFITKNQQNISDVIRYIEEEIGTDTLELGDGYERLIITPQSIYKRRHVGYNNMHLKNGSFFQQEIIKMLCEFKVPPEISKKMKGYAILALNIKNGKIMDCEVEKRDIPMNNDDDAPFGGIYCRFYPHGVASEDMPREGYKNYKSNYYKENYCSENHYIFNKYWTFALAGKCYG